MADELNEDPVNIFRRADREPTRRRGDRKGRRRGHRQKRGARKERLKARKEANKKKFKGKKKKGKKRRGQNVEAGKKLFYEQLFGINSISFIFIGYLFVSFEEAYE